jgi:hypothetical protein
MQFPLEITGFAPEPYELNSIGVAAVPLEGGMSRAIHLCPDWKRIESPGENDEAFTFAIDFHAEPGT